MPRQHRGRRRYRQRWDLTRLSDISLEVLGVRIDTRLFAHMLLHCTTCYPTRTPRCAFAKRTQRLLTAIEREIARRGTPIPWK